MLTDAEQPRFPESVCFAPFVWGVNMFFKTIRNLTITGVSAAAMLCAGSASAAISVTWADWTVVSAGIVGGSIGGVGVTYTGPTYAVQTGAGTDIDYWIDGGYTMGSVNRPTGTDIIELGAGGRKTINFSAPVTDLYMAFTSWQGNTVTFDRPFSVVSEGCGYWGCGTFGTFGGGTGFNGLGEVHGVLKFSGTFSSLSFEDTSEDWHGFTVGLGAGGVPEPATWAMMIAGFGMVGATLRSRRRITA